MNIVSMLCPVLCNPDNELAVEIGRILSQSGYWIINGGYSGTMEGSARGCSSVSGYKCIGVIVPKIFPGRPIEGNGLCTELIVKDTFSERILAMEQVASAIICLPGQLGTLLELLYAWNNVAYNSRDLRPLILHYRWKPLIEFIQSELHIPEKHMKSIVWLNAAEEIVSILHSRGIRCSTTN